MTDRVAEFLAEVGARAGELGMACGARELLACIRDIPYGRPSTRTWSAVHEEWRGTCSGKHLLAQHVLARIGLPSTLYLLPYRLDDALDALPAAVVAPHTGKGVWDVHNFLVMHTPHGPVTVDVTWPLALAPHGFPTTDWDGRSDFRIAAGRGEPVVVEEGADLGALKDAMLARANTAPAREPREELIAALARFATANTTLRTRAEGIERTLRGLRPQS